MQHNAEYFVKHLNMLEHPEGGWYKETFRSSESIAAQHLPSRFGGIRNFSTSIYFLLSGKQFSAFHRIKSDEIWHFYYGCSLKIYVIDLEGCLRIIGLGVK